MRRHLHTLTGGSSARPLFLLVSLGLTDTLDVAAFSLLLPEIRDYFGVSLSTILAVVAVATLLPLVVAVPLGFVSDRVRRTRLLGIGFVLSGLFSLGTGLSSTLIVLGLMRLGAGLGACFEGSGQSLISDAYPQDRRAAVLSALALGPTIGLLVGPLLAGLLGVRYGWQLPFVVAGLPTLALAGGMFTVKDPPRGGQERKVQGAPADLADLEDTPPGWTEGWRIARSVRTLRRLWASLPFLVGSVVITGSLFPVLLHDEFGLSTTARGVLASAQHGATVAGLLLGAPLLSAMLAKSAERLVSLAGLLASVAAGLLLVISISPWLPLTASAIVAMGLALAPLGPVIRSLISLTVPARARGFALSFGSLFVALGVLPAPFVGAISDRLGVRAAIAVMSPIFLIGTLIIATAGASVAADLRAANAAAMAGQIVRRSRAEGRTKLLVCRDLDAGYGQVQILFGVDLEVEQGEIIALLGTNGAGKSTLLSAISGSNPASNGAILFDGDEITQLPASDHLRRGIVSVPGGKAIFPGLTVAAHLDLALWAAEKADSASRLAEVYRLFPRLHERRREPAGHLSGGEQQMLALSQAFLARPRLLMIDELSLGLAPVVVEQLLGIVRALQAEGATIILVEQSVNVALTLAERAVFMEKGEVRFVGPTAELMNRPDVLRSVFLAGAGTATGSYARGRSRSVLPGGDDVVLRATDVCCSFGGIRALRGASLELRAGKTLGIVGPNGAGKTTLFDVISGFLVPDSGTVELLSEDITDTSASYRASRGLGRSFQDARLFPALTVEEAVLVALDRHHKARNLAAAAVGIRRARMAESAARKRAARLLGLLGIEELADTFARELSTGSRRLVELACVLAGEPTVLLLDEPSSGIAQKETEELPGVLDRIKYETGCAMVVIEHDMQLLSALSDELLAMELGQHVVRGAPELVLNDPRVVAAYLGNSESAINRSDQSKGKAHAWT